MKMTCNVCANQCSLEEGQAGFCNARFNKSGVIYSSAYGKITSISLDPIEKNLSTIFTLAVKFYHWEAMAVILYVPSARTMKYPWLE